MAKYVPFAIAQTNSGFVKNRNAYVIPEDAFEELFNATVWRGVVKRKHGLKKIGRLCRAANFTLQTTGTGAGTDTYILKVQTISNAAAAQVTTTVNHELSTGDVVLMRDIVGMDSGGMDLNDQEFTITVTGATTFTVPVDTTLWNAYTSGGVIRSDVLRGVRQTQPDAALVPGAVVIKIDDGGANDTEFTDDGDGVGFTRTAGTTYQVLGNSTITGITNAANAEVTTSAAHGLATGDMVFLDGIVGIINETGESGDLKKTITLNDRLVKVTVTAATTFTIGIDTQVANGWSTYDSAGTVYPNNINYTTGEINLKFDATFGTDETVTASVEYCPGLPVMGFHRHELANINDERAVAFDTTYAYQYNSSGEKWEEYNLSAGTTWTGGDADFFWSLSYWQPAANTYLWTTNFNSTDRIRYHDGTTGWANLTLNLNSGGAQLLTARMLFAYRGRLVALNTIETGPQAHPQRARFSAVGNPLATNAWREDVAGNGGYIDAPTGEHIVSAEFIRDTLIVGFERSTWALRYSGNETIPFYWERINKELGAESTFSKVAFDQGVMMVGERSINTCNGNSVQPVNDVIPDQAYEINNVNNGRERVHGIRDFYNRMVYWAYPYGDALLETHQKWPNRVLAFNYEENTWSIYDDHITALGMWQNTKQTTWADLAGITWQEADFPWDSPQETDEFVQIIAGNQQGYTHIMNPIRGTTTSAEGSLQITGVTAANPVQLTVPDHNLVNGDAVRVVGIVGFGDVLNGANYIVERVDADTIELKNADSSGVELVGSGTYLGGGELERRQNFRMRSKKFQMLDIGSRNYLGHIDFLLDTTTAGEVSCNIYVNYNDDQPVNSLTDDNFYNTVVPTSASQFSSGNREKEWQRFYCMTDAQFWNWELTLDNTQLIDETKSNSDVDLNATIVYSNRGARIVD